MNLYILKVLDYLQTENSAATHTVNSFLEIIDFSKLLKISSHLWKFNTHHFSPELVHKLISPVYSYTTDFFTVNFSIISRRRLDFWKGILLSGFPLPVRIFHCTYMCHV